MSKGKATNLDIPIILLIGIGQVDFMTLVSLMLKHLSSLSIIINILVKRINTTGIYLL